MLLPILWIQFTKTNNALENQIHNKNPRQKIKNQTKNYCGD